MAIPDISKRVIVSLFDIMEAIILAPSVPKLFSDKF